MLNASLACRQSIDPPGPQNRDPYTASDVSSMSVKQKLAPISQEIVCASTGPDAGITDVPRLPTEDKSHTTAGCNKWDVKADFAYGLALSLYERNIIGGSGLSGDPIADVFAITARPNCAILAVADGVGWGDKPRLAAKCAVLGAMQTMNKHICEATTVQEVFHLLNESLWNAQKLILSHNATLTTLSVAVVVQLEDLSWKLCTMKIGDSPIFVYQPTQGRVIEVGARAEDGLIKVLTDSGGCLGPSKGDKPDTSNLTFCYMSVLPGDIVFATSDGIADNYRTGRVDPNKRGEEDCVTEHLLKRLECVRSELDTLCNYHFTAQDVSACLANHARLLTDELRVVHEGVQREGVPRKVLQTKNPELYSRLKTTPGKLDHACIVAYEVKQLINR